MCVHNTVEWVQRIPVASPGENIHLTKISISAQAQKYASLLFSRLWMDLFRRALKMMLSGSAVSRRDKDVHMLFSACVLYCLLRYAALRINSRVQSHSLAATLVCPCLPCNLILRKCRSSAAKFLNTTCFKLTYLR